jgi:ribosomal protein S18 acetylase RimI-like enzyme
MHIRPWTDKLSSLMHLLLLADPEERALYKYIEYCDIFTAIEDGVPVGVCAVLPVDENRCELKNLAVAPAYQRKGYGRQLVEYVLNRYKSKFAFMLVGTSDATQDTIRFYKRCGFQYARTIKNFFIDNYVEPVFDGGVQCVDMIVLEHCLKDSPK